MYFIFDGNNEELARTGKSEVAVRLAMLHGNGASVFHGNNTELEETDEAVLVYNAEPTTITLQLSELTRQMVWGETPYIN